MPEQNQPIQGAFGGIYSADLPELRQTEAQQAQLQLYQARATQQQTAREQAMYDRMQQAEVSKILPNDVPEFSGLYGQYRSAQMYADTTRFDNDTKGITARAQANTQAVSLFAQAMKFANDSIQQKQNMNTLLSQYKDPTKRPLLADNFPDLMEKAQSLPTSQLKNVKIGNQKYDLTNLDTYAYPGGNIDYGKLEKGAVGTPKPVGYQETVPVDKRGIQSNVTSYEYGSDPAQYKSQLQGNLATNLGRRDAQYQLSMLLKGNPDALNQVNQAYSALTPQDWARRTGKPIPQNLEPTNPNDPADVYSSYLAKKYAVQVQPRATQKVQTNMANELFLKDQLNQRMEGIRQGHREQLVQLGVDYRKASAQDQEALNEGIIDNDFDTAQNPKAGGKQVVGQNGQVEYVAPTNDITRSILKTSGKDASYPDEIHYNSDGSQIRGVFFQRDKNGQKIPDGQGSFVEDPNKGGWVTTPSVKAMVGKTLGRIAQPPSGEKMYVVPSGQKMTMGQLLKLYPQDKINQYIQAGVIK
jgi:hypothetical protein